MQPFSGHTKGQLKLSSHVRQLLETPLTGTMALGNLSGPIFLMGKAHPENEMKPRL